MKRNTTLGLLVVTAALCAVTTGCSNKETAAPDQGGSQGTNQNQTAGDSIMNGVENAGDALMGDSSDTTHEGVVPEDNGVNGAVGVPGNESGGSANSKSRSKSHSGANERLGSGVPYDQMMGGR